LEASALRDYKKEYRDYHSSSKQKKLRALRNKANRTLSPGAGMEVDHKVPLSKGGSNGKSNWRVVSRKANREKYNKTANVRPRVALWLHDGKGNLLVQDDRSKGLSFKFPGGGIDPGQTVNDAAKLEALEEVGYRLASPPKAIPGIRAKTIPWRAKFLEYAANKGRGKYTASKHYHRLALAGGRDEALLGSEGDALKSSWVPIKEILEETRRSAANPENDLNYFDEERLRVAEIVNKMLNEKTASEFDWATAGQHSIVPGVMLGSALAATGYGHYTGNERLKNLISNRKAATIGSILGGVYGSTYGDEPSIVNSLAGSGIGFGVGSAIDSILKRKNKLDYFKENKAALMGSKAGATALGAIGGLPGAALGGELGTQLGAKIDERINKKEASTGPLSQFMKLSRAGGALEKKANAAASFTVLNLKHLPLALAGGLGAGYLGLRSGLDDNKIRALFRTGVYTGFGTSKGLFSKPGLSYEDVLYPTVASGVAQLPLALADGLDSDVGKYGNILTGHLGGAFGLYQAGKARMQRSREKKAFFEGSHYFSGSPVRNAIRMATPVGTAILGGLASSYAGQRAGIADEDALGSLFGSGVAGGFGLGEILTGTPNVNYRHVIYPYLGGVSLGSLAGLLPDTKSTSRAGLYMTGAGGMAGRMLADRNTKLLEKESRSADGYMGSKNGRDKLRSTIRAKLAATLK
jgi:8-oxo-dGTP pyrophosphatase MutT (NUDIX family)